MKKKKLLDQLKAARRGSREAALQDARAFVPKRKVHKSKKAYNRKNCSVKISE